MTHSAKLMLQKREGQIKRLQGRLFASQQAIRGALGSISQRCREVDARQAIEILTRALTI